MIDQVQRNDLVSVIPRFSVFVALSKSYIDPPSTPSDLTKVYLRSLPHHPHQGRPPRFRHSRAPFSSSPPLLTCRAPQMNGCVLIFGHEQGTLGQRAVKCVSPMLDERFSIGCRKTYENSVRASVFPPASLGSQLAGSGGAVIGS